MNYNPKWNVIGRGKADLPSETDELFAQLDFTLTKAQLAEVGFALDKQVLAWVMPYHDGAIRYFKDKGVWTAELQKHNDSLVRRQEILATAWDKALGETSAKKVKAKDFPALWMEIRAASLREAGLDPYWEK